MAKVWLITGISRGLGHALTMAALAEGHRVIGTTRDGATPAGLDGELVVLPFEAADPAAAERLATDALAVHGRLDVLVNNAGYGLLGPIEETDDEAARDQFEVNVLGPIRLIRAVLPRLRAQGSGHIVNIASIAAIAPSLGSGIYAASKAALSALSYSLADEVAPFGLWVSVVSPGAFRTEFLGGGSIRRTGAATAYPDVESSLAILAAKDGRQAGDPARGASVILQLVAADEPPLDLLLGEDALERAERRGDRLAADIKGWRAVSASTAVREHAPSV